jgi:hypothetical protein
MIEGQKFATFWLWSFVCVRGLYGNEKMKIINTLMTHNFIFLYHAFYNNNDNLNTLSIWNYFKSHTSRTYNWDQIDRCYPYLFKKIYSRHPIEIELWNLFMQIKYLLHAGQVWLVCHFFICHKKKIPLKYFSTQFFFHLDIEKSKTYVCTFN